MTIRQHDTDDLSLRTEKPFSLKLSGEPELFTVRSLVVDVNFGFVAIPRIMAARQALDVALVADAIGRRDQDRAEDFDRAEHDGRRAEETCRPESELLRLRGRQIAEE